jgi:hypothetical protein
MKIESMVVLCAAIFKKVKKLFCHFCDNDEKVKNPAGLRVTMMGSGKTWLPC